MAWLCFRIRTHFSTNSGAKESAAACCSTSASMAPPPSSTPVHRVHGSGICRHHGCARTWLKVRRSFKSLLKMPCNKSLKYGEAKDGISYFTEAMTLNSSDWLGCSNGRCPATMA